MRTTKTYLSGCTWCMAEGCVNSTPKGGTSGWTTKVCPVCNGSKTVLVTEVIEDDEPIKESASNFRSNDPNQFNNVYQAGEK